MVYGRQLFEQTPYMKSRSVCGGGRCWADLVYIVLCKIIFHVETSPGSGASFNLHPLTATMWPFSVLAAGS